MSFYTPHLDELFIGMECDIQNLEGNWESSVITNLHDDDDVNWYRIKELDADDIIAEGFELTSETRKYKVFQKILFSNNDPYMVEIRLYKSPIFPFIDILKNEQIIVNGIILKNKYDFKWLIEKLI